MPTQPDRAGSALEKLAQRSGISTRYENAYGEMLAVPPETITRLLGSMNIPVATEADAAVVLQRLDQEDAERVLPPTIVAVPRDGVCSIALRNVPPARPLEWAVTLETGETRTGRCSAEAGDGAHAGTLVLPLRDLPLGYHHLRLPELGAEAHLIVSPGQCWLPHDTAQGHWGIAVQLYLVRSATNWGIGDFSDLRVLVEMAARRGCSFIGLNPLHQMFLDSPEAASPYSPATRLFLNPLYIDVRAVPEWNHCPRAQALVEAPAFKSRLEGCRAARLVDYAAVAGLKLDALRLLHRTFHHDAAPERREAFAAFRATKGQSLKRASLFQVVRQEVGQGDPSRGDWRHWPEALQAIGSPELAAFAQEHQPEIDFQDWLQFVADEQLRHAAKVAQRAGMAIGLYRDLAVGCDASGAETWADPNAFVEATLVGAPPDIFNPAGQNWGLPPLDPVAIAQDGYRSFAQLIRANMQHAGGLRIDHVMGLKRLFFIPEGLSPSEGAYVGFPLDDLIGVLALESQRQRCLVVGEDLGTVPAGFRERLEAANILSYRVLFFEQDFSSGSFKPPEAYPRLAFANTGSHDLPTLMAWWRSEDVTLKEGLGLYATADEARSQEDRRERERQSILEAFVHAGLLEAPTEAAVVSAERFAVLAHRYLARTPSLLVATQLDDMTRDVEPVNIPGTSTEHANWRRKYRVTLEELENDKEAWALVQPLGRNASRT
ncbi:4-alpha-glucanotransferase [Devosia sp. PTR5]|uniref:4-alpha-glucanotransferase n=1 Tax=Devosia oryzisoli TaxID=2774138 RepID=A0A927FWN6_9HYPH|nr:4-alpha-glucanotransferase [Devosia oryzisoli]MBD8066892.1 4-alpha-glucanotransferase [Devosia oryzisoli]